MTGRRSATRTLFLLLALSAGGAGPAAPPEAPARAARRLGGVEKSRIEGREALRAACRWLWSRQAADGGWHSDTYGLFRSGQALTPFVLDLLLRAPRDPSVDPPDGEGAPPGGVERALEFIRKRTGPDGALGLADPALPEYPNYATAYGLRCLVRAGRKEDRELIARMRSRLLAEQYGASRGLGPESPAFGGWGFGGRRPPGSTGHMDLSHTRRVLEALREASVEDGVVYDRAQTFLRRVQKLPPDGAPPGPGDHRGYDGGFYFSPVVLDANKAGPEPERPGSYRSYATATCDGVLALLAAGVPPGDPRVAGASRWLAEHPRLDFPEGIPPHEPMRWGQALHYYHLAVHAEACAALGVGDSRFWAEITRLLALRQRPDGSFANANHLMKEDDPLLATALAARVLCCAAR